jgi:hypothetical protein
MRSIGYGEGLSPRTLNSRPAPCLAPQPKFASANFDLSLPAKKSGEVGTGQRRTTRGFINTSLNTMAMSPLCIAHRVHVRKINLKN